MTEYYVAALDQGTTSSRCMVFDRHGHMVSISQRAHEQFFPGPGHVEHDAEQIWQTICKIMPEALAEAGIDARQIIGLGITNQRETTVVWDRHTGRPVHRAIVWQDMRTADIIAKIAGEFDAAEITARTGLPLSTYFSGPRMRWLFDQDPSLRPRAQRGDILFGTVDSWLLWNLTGGVDGGVHSTDVTNASRTLLMNLQTLDWDDELLSIFDVPRAMLPQIRPTLARFGTTREPIEGIEVTALIGDQQAALFGQTAFDAGAAKCTFGTGSFLLLNTGGDVVSSSHGLISTVAYAIDGEPPVYALEGSIAVAGALVDWCRTTLGFIDASPEIETVANTVTDNGGCYIVPAFSGLLAPHWDHAAQGIVVGLTGYTSRGHLARAILEAVAFQVCDVVEAMDSDAGVSTRSLAVDGGMTSNNLLMRTVANLLGVPVIRPMMTETVALGAAYAAGLSAGYWPDKAVLRRNWQRAAEWLPEMDDSRRTVELARWRDAVSLASAWGRTRR
ncbi:Glycerol kinase [Mycolicibacterium vanbaalenii]|uniref:glycerol kinase n=1 Tax=Mycolicibacterium vanbaalenii TaxID=110539 RepID=A0A5S9R7T2_MYCVN|nr:glycerol kinase GlpK [Mycolicibacterium vanbaalenii]CAA0132051.1 Glycerol kinase [Mycolicibacterium vanbaalenii]